jgi:DNA-binding LacI/PurR family transcriptional regulator
MRRTHAAANRKMLDFARVSMRNFRAMRRKAKASEADGGVRKAVSPRVSLKELASHVGLSPTALSLVLNDAPAAAAIPQETKNRIHAAAHELGYRPNYLARALRSQRTRTIGVLVPEMSSYSGMILSGIQERLPRENYWYILASHNHNEQMIEHHRAFFLERGIEGLIAVDTPCVPNYALPVVAVSRHDEVAGVTNIVLNHERAARIALEHLIKLGHERIAFFKGQEFSSDTEARWQAIREVTKKMNLKMIPELCVQLEGNTPSPETGYQAARKLLAAGAPFTALFAFNDVSAVGAMRAFNEAGLKVPEDISVVGFDDVDFAAYQNPPLTTIRQPLYQMGQIAAEIILQRIGARDADLVREIYVEPELIVRSSTGKSGDRRRNDER